MHVLCPSHPCASLIVDSGRNWRYDSSKLIRGEKRSVRGSSIEIYLGNNLYYFGKMEKCSVRGFSTEIYLGNNLCYFGKTEKHSVRGFSIEI